MMIFLSQLRHELVVERSYEVTDGMGDPTYTDYGALITEYAPLPDTIRGLVQPLSQREIAIASQAGAVIGDHKIFLLAGTDVTTADRIAFAEGYPDDDLRRFEILSIADAGGQDFSLEVAAQLLTSSVEPGIAVGS